MFIILNDTSRLVSYDYVGSKRRDASEGSRDLKKACRKSEGVDTSYQGEPERPISHPKTFFLYVYVIIFADLIFNSLMMLEEKRASGIKVL